ncbi:hypothetical protein BJ912DRAFT_649385 [Pholiota molesta]|nr:hypothetical protein BJ912DRAFT_649385 [Pholiota molesta]
MSTTTTGHLATRTWCLGATAVAAAMTTTTTASSREAMAPVQLMSMAEMRRSRRSDPHPPKTLDPADSLQSNPSVQIPVGRQRVAAAAATTTTSFQGTVRTLTSEHS